MLADRLKQAFVDADRELEKENRTSIREMVGQHGWEYFRGKERETLMRLCKGDRQVIATGGGIILSPENIRLMKENGKVIWLKADAMTIKSRMLQDEKTESQRPALTEKGLLNEIEEMLSFRSPLYENAADISVDTDSAGTEDICSILIENL